MHYIKSKQMKSINRLFVIFALIIISLTGCKSVPKKAEKIEPMETPEWFKNLEAVFPEAEYLVQMEEGTTKDESLVNCATALASYLNTNVRRIIEADTTSTESVNGAVDTDREVRTHYFAYTNLDVFAMEYTVPYYDADQNKWFCVAYINRETAWKQFEPEVRDAEKAFLSVYELSKAEEEPLKIIRILKQAKEESSAFIEKLYTATLFSRPLTQRNFGEVRETVNGIPGEIQEQKERCLMYLNVPEDFSKIVAGAATKAITDCGFSVTDSKSECFYSVDVIVDYNRADEEDLIVMYPSVKVAINGSNGAIYIYQCSSDKLLSYNESKAKKNACTAIAEKLSETLALDMKAVLRLD